MTIHLSALLQKYICSIASDSYPNEIGGLILQDEDSRQIVWSIPNVHSEPRHNYAGEAQETLKAYAWVYDDSHPGRKVVCEWHSHPTSEAIPSEVDRNQYRSNPYLLIVGLADFPEYDLRMWDLDNQEVELRF